MNCHEKFEWLAKKFEVIEDVGLIEHNVLWIFHCNLGKLKRHANTDNHFSKLDIVQTNSIGFFVGCNTYILIIVYQSSRTKLTHMLICLNSLKPSPSKKYCLLNLLVNIIVIKLGINSFPLKKMNRQYFHR